MSYITQIVYSTIKLLGDNFTENEKGRLTWERL